MRAAARFAYGNARMRVLKSGLLDSATIAFLASPAGAGDARVSDLFGDLYPAVCRWYATLLKGYPSGRELLIRMFRLQHELENLKVLWRSAVRDRRLPAVCWRPLEPLATLSPSFAGTTLELLVDKLQCTPYGALATETLRSHGADTFAAEVAFDRWGTSRLREAAEALPERERSARELTLSLIRERDLDLLRRGVRSYGLEPSFAANLTTVLAGQWGIRATTRLASWGATAEPLALVLPRALRQVSAAAASWPTLVGAVRSGRLNACRRTLRSAPFQLGPAIAAVQLREEELRVLLSIAAAHRRDSAAPRAYAEHAPDNLET